MRIALIVVSILFGLVLQFAFLNWLTARTYKPSRQEVTDVLRRVQDGTMSWYEWDEFVCVPMRHDALLEEIRQACATMETAEYKCRENLEDAEKWIYNQKGLQEVRRVLERLEQQI